MVREKLCVLRVITSIQFMITTTTTFVMHLHCHLRRLQRLNESNIKCGVICISQTMTVGVVCFCYKTAFTPEFCHSAIPEFAKSSKLSNFRNCRRFSADSGLRLKKWSRMDNFVLWRHCNLHSVKESLFLSLKNGIQPAFSSCPIYKSYIGQTNRKRNESALLVWATDRLSARAGAAGCSPSRDIVIHSAGRYSEESSRIHRRINNICQILWEVFKFGAEFC